MCGQTRCSGFPTFLEHDIFTLITWCYIIEIITQFEVLLLIVWLSNTGGDQLLVYIRFQNFLRLLINTSCSNFCVSFET